jgi:hypothetical protein
MPKFEPIYNYLSQSMNRLSTEMWLEFAPIPIFGEFLVSFFGQLPINAPRQ